MIAQSISANGKVGVLVEVNCETDFVAKNDAFKALSDGVAQKLVENSAVDLEADRVAAVQKLGENILIRRNARLEVQGSGAVASLHSHRWEGGRFG